MQLQGRAYCPAFSFAGHSPDESLVRRLPPQPVEQFADAVKGMEMSLAQREVLKSNRTAEFKFVPFLCDRTHWSRSVVVKIPH